MKRVLLIALAVATILSCNVFATTEKATVKKISENIIEVSVNSDEKIKVTGYTVTKDNIIVYYFKDSKGKGIDSIKIDINTVPKPYKVIISDSELPQSYQPFKDIKNSSAKDYIRSLYDLGFINGYEEDNTFRPNNNITRAEFITLVSRILNLKENNTENEQKFDDLTSSHWAYEDVLKAVDNNIIEGYKEDNKTYMRPDRNVTIAEAAKIIDSAFKINNKSVLNYDVRFSRHWAKENIQSLVNSNIISFNDTFYKSGDLNKAATREDIAILLSRAVRKMTDMR